VKRLIPALILGLDALVIAVGTYAAWRGLS
jgi:hypothetical protein